MVREYRKFVTNRGNKVYIPILNVFGYRSRLSRKLFARAAPAQDYAQRFRKRFRRLKEASHGREIQT